MNRKMREGTLFSNPEGITPQITESLMAKLRRSRSKSGRAESSGTEMDRSSGITKSSICTEVVSINRRSVRWWSLNEILNLSIEDQIKVEFPPLTNGATDH